MGWEGQSWAATGQKRKRGSKALGECFLFTQIKSVLLELFEMPPEAPIINFLKRYRPIRKQRFDL